MSKTLYQRDNVRIDWHKNCAFDLTTFHIYIDGQLIGCAFSFTRACEKAGVIPG